MIHLDTSFLIRALVAGTREDAALRSWITQGETIGIAALAWTEFLCGPVAPEARVFAEQILEAPVAFGIAESELAARLFNDSGRRRGSLVDCMIAATAQLASAQLATANRADFMKLEPLGARIAAY